MPLEFEPYGSMFVVFRKAVKSEKLKVKSADGKNFSGLTPVQELAGPWQVQFDPLWFYPTTGLSAQQAAGKATFAKLEDWTQRPEEAIRNFSGTAVYRTEFIIQNSAVGKISAELRPLATATGPRLFLDLGTVKETARVRLNGKDLGVVWCHPWRVEITDAVKAGANSLEIDVVNLWPNRLIGDAALAAEQRRTRTNIGSYKAGSPRLASGLIGPVSILAGESEK